MQKNSKIKVLIVDDSTTICSFLEATFSGDPDLEVVGKAYDAFQARDLIKVIKPDVITLDVEMPGMDGVTFLKNLMRLNPIPVVMFSSLTNVGASATIEALQAGAVDFVPKHSARSDVSLENYLEDLIKKVKSAATVTVRKSSTVEDVAEPSDLSICAKKISRGKNASTKIKRLVAIGASTGGPEALGKFVKTFSSTNCSLVIAQHMPARFMEPFAKRLSDASAFDIRIAEHGEKLLPGRGYVAPGDQHLSLVSDADGFRWKLSSTDPVKGYRPSVDVLFESVAQVAPLCSVGVLMTGMGADGAVGLKSLNDNGALTLIQDKNTSAVWGMPGQAHALGAHDEELPLTQIAPALNKLLR